MKQLLKFIVTLAFIVCLGQELLAQGNVNIINSGTNLAVVSYGDSTDSTLIAQQYIGGKVAFPAAGGATVISSNGVNVYGMSNIVVYGYTMTASIAGGTNLPNTLIPHTSGSRVGVFITNMGPPSVYPGTNLDIGIKLGAYASNAVPDYVVPGAQCQFIPFQGGYNGEISARYTGTNALPIGGTPGLIITEIGNSPGQ